MGMQISSVGDLGEAPVRASVWPQSFPPLWARGPPQPGTYRGASGQSEQGLLPQALTSVCKRVRDPFPNPQGPGREFHLWGLHDPLLPPPLPCELCLSGARPAGEGAGSASGSGVFRSGLGPSACPGDRLGTRVTEGGYVWGCSGGTAGWPQMWDGTSLEIGPSRCN